MEFIVLAVFGGIVAAIAHSRGRSPIGWFFIGFFAGCIGLILVLVLPDLNLEEERRSKLATENKRLKEQIRKERQVADQRHAETIGRLGAHDAVLGLDTRAGGDGALAGAPDGARREHHRPRQPLALRRQRGRGDAGAGAFSELVALWSEGGLDGNSLVWSQGMDDWSRIEDLPDVEGELRRG